MFTPPPGVRSGRDVTLSWWLAEKPSFARLEILDASGAVVRAFEADTATAEPEEGPGRGGGRFGGGPQNVPLKAGLSEMSWDLTGEPFTSFDGMSYNFV